MTNANAFLGVGVEDIVLVVFTAASFRLAERAFLLRACAGVGLGVCDGEVASAFSDLPARSA